MLIRSTPTNYQQNNARLGRVSAVVSGGRVGSLGSDTKPQSKNNTVAKYDARKQVFSLKNQARFFLPNHREWGCCKNRVNKDALVGVKVATHQNNNGVTRKATLTNVFRCDSIWVCPVCSQRILAKRGKEIEQALQMVEYKGGSVFMLTLTHSHQLGEALKPKFKLLGKALTRFFGDRTMQALFAKCGLIGHIMAL